MRIISPIDAGHTESEVVTGSSHQILDAPLADTQHAIKPLIRWALCLFVFSIPFEYPGRSIPVEITTLTGGIFVLATLTQLQVCYRRIPAPLWWFVLYLYAYVFSYVSNGGEHFADAVTLYLQIVLPMLLFWSAGNLLHDEALNSRVWLSLAIACTIRALLPIMGLGSAVAEANLRVTALGQDPNYAAAFLTIGFISLVGLLSACSQVRLAPLLLGFGMLCLIGIGIVQTGSRGGLVALMTGLVATTLARGSIVKRLRSVLGAFVLLLLVAVSIYRSDSLRTRFEMTVESGQMAGREMIFPALWSMFQERPIVGWGPIRNQYELQNRIRLEGRERKSAHNTPLEVITTTGLLGAIPLFIGMGLCMLGAWKARGSTRGVTPLALVMAMGMMSLSLNIIASKSAWFVLAYALASSRLVRRQTLATSSSYVTRYSRPGLERVPLGEA